MQARPGETAEPSALAADVAHETAPVESGKRLPAPAVTAWRHFMLIRKLLIALALALVIGAIPSAAVAAPAVPGGETTTYTFPVSEYCAFPIEITLVGNEVSRTGHGRVFYTGALSGTVTN